MNDEIIITEAVKSLISPQVAYENCIVPIKCEAGTLYVGMIDENNLRLLNDLKFLTGFEIQPIEYSSDDILNKLKEVYPDYTNNNSGNGLKDLSEDSHYSAVEFVNKIIQSAVDSKVSDIHFEVYEKTFRVRFRIDGHLREVSNLNTTKGLPITSRMKVMANLDISEKRRPQDGRIKFNYKEKSLDIRVSSLPTSFGEKVVLRILDKSNLQLDINKLGLLDNQKKLLGSKIKLPFGMILVTGPTGSGKTTTLYSSLQEIHTIEKNILTVEDPIEYNLEGINQCSVKSDIGFTFASALRSFLRQDPDVIMVGEIRDKETAEIAIRASLTGHLVFSTLHTNDSISGITRLIDMGIEPYLVVSSVKMIVAQRLVRMLCDCKTVDELPISNGLPASTKIYKANGCNKCNNSGYRGRSAIFELLTVDEAIADLVIRGESQNRIKEFVNSHGFISLRQAGLELVKEGKTSYEEVLRETMV